MASGQGLDVAAIAETILDGINSHYAAAGVELPQRRIIAPGAPELVAWDCPMVIVTCSGIGLGPAPGVKNGAQRTGNPISAMGVRHAIFAVQIVRKTPEATQGGLRPPDVAKLTKAGLAHMRDMGLLSQALVEVCSTIDQQLRKLPDALVQPGAVDSVGPEGGMAGVQGSLAVTVGTLV